MKYEELTGTIIKKCIKVHETLGPGLLESVYEEALCFELSNAGIAFKRQQAIPVVYGGIKLELGFRADVIVESKIIVELKSVETAAPVHAKTVLTYMRLTGIDVGLLINFNVALLREGITRLADDKSKFARRHREGE